VFCYGTNTSLDDYEPVSISGEGTVTCRIERIDLINGTYYLDVAVHKRDGYPYDYHRNLTTFFVSSTLHDEGIVRLPHGWEFPASVLVKRLEK
jgi:ABC-2 type transport system ATP-binding protein/lipopolysaccharide transport system ATP-binding protein